MREKVSNWSFLWEHTVGAIMKVSVGFHQKVKNRFSHDPTTLFSAHTREQFLIRIHCCCVTIARKCRQSRCPSNWWMDKEVALLGCLKIIDFES